MICDMCGTEKGPFFKATIEGTQMSVCSNCMRYASHAQQIKEPLTKKQEKKLKKNQQKAEEGYVSAYDDEEATIQLINPDYGGIVKQARERRGLRQSQLAEQLAIKESVLHSIESGRHEPDFNLARKLEKHLRVSLIEERKEKKHASTKRSLSGPMTIADLMKK